MIVLRETLTDAECHSCGAPILWARTTAGKLLPLDRCPRSDGYILREMPDGSTLMYVSHFATCHNADKHRRK